MRTPRVLDIPVLSPYLIPEQLRHRKVVNLGDGFILRAVERHFEGSFAPERVFSPRTAPDEAAIKVMQAAELVVLAGANQLNDRYTVWPGLNATKLQEAGLRFVPFGIGLHGEDGHCDGMTEETKALLEAIHERIAFSSWRCPWTVAYLRENLPHLESQFLMTGCPVAYDQPLLEGERFSEAESSVAVTATERGDFWRRESLIIDAVAKRFPRAKKYFVAHQNFSPAAWHERPRHRLFRTSPAAMADKVEALRAYARAKGFQPVAPADADACIAFYRDVDVHVGTRLHAHLLFLSRNKRSFLVPVDGRSGGMAEFLGFPLPNADELHRHWDFDFEIVRRHARQTYPALQKFLGNLSQ